MVRPPNFELLANRVCHGGKWHQVDRRDIVQEGWVCWLQGGDEKKCRLVMRAALRREGRLEGHRGNAISLLVFSEVWGEKILGKTLNYRPGVVQPSSCANCGQAEPDEGGRYCAACKEKRRKWARDRYHRLK